MEMSRQAPKRYCASCTNTTQHVVTTFRFLVLPCINPYGYVHNTREDRSGIDLNRVFEVDNAPEEARLVKTAVEGKRFDFAIDFHEDWEAAGFYFYEGRKNGNWIGPEVIRNVESVCPIDREHDESDLPIADGVFKVDPGWGLQGFTPYLLAFHSDHVMICETPTSLPMHQRIAAHLKALETVLKHYNQANGRCGFQPHRSPRETSLSESSSVVHRTQRMDWYSIAHVYMEINSLRPLETA